jgi:hypothetical protein
VKAGSGLAAPQQARSARSRTALAVQLGAVVLAFVLVSVLVVTSSRAAFVAQTGNGANQVSSAGITLSDNESGTAMFNNVTGLVPGQNTDRCITVTYTGTADPLPVVLYAGSTPTGGLAPYLNLIVDVAPATGDPAGACTNFPASPTSVYSGTLSDFATNYTGFANGRSTGWDPSTTSPDARTFRFRVAVQNSAAAQNLTTSFGFTWETQTP